MEDAGGRPGSSEFGTLLRRYRLAAGLSQETLAERARVSLDGISALERGYRRTPQRETLALLAGALALSDDQREAFEAAAARPRLPRRRGESSVTVGPWVGAESASLPLSLTRFIGREADLDRIRSLAREHRLVTITGAGGVGKTQTTLHAAAGLSDVVESIRFVELAPVAGRSLVLSAIAAALGVQEIPNRPLLGTLTAYLNARAFLLILDNCEHLVEAIAPVVRAILGDCPHVRILATSREPLSAAGERTYRLPSLSENDAVALFADRAQAVDSHFALSAENAPTVSEICRRLDGMPLAIELAAARVNMFSVQELVAELDDRFKVLTGGERTAPRRQQTMSATIDWSYNLLSSREQRLLQRLSVFAGGCTMYAARTVCAGDGLPEGEILDLLSALVAKSLVLAEPSGDVTRYRLLESTRAYASQQLAESGERDSVADRHLRYLRDFFAELLEAHRHSPRTADLAAALQTELQDVRSVLDDALSRSAVIEGGELLANLLGSSWHALGLEAEAMARLQAYLAVIPVGESRLRAHLSMGLSYLRENAGESVLALDLATHAVEHARSSGDVSLIAVTLQAYVQPALTLQRIHDAERAVLELEAIPNRSTGTRLFVLAARAVVAWSRGDLAGAFDLYEQLAQEQRALGDTNGEQGTALNLAELEHARGRTHRAIEIVRETLPAVRTGPDTTLLVDLLVNLAGYLAASNDLSGAASAACEAVRIRSALEPEHIQMALAIEQVALVCATRGSLARAALLEGYADAAIQVDKIVRDTAGTTTGTHRRLVALIREGFDPEEVARLNSEGAALAPADAIALALDEFEPSGK